MRNAVNHLQIRSGKDTEFVAERLPSEGDERLCQLQRLDRRIFGAQIEDFEVVGHALKQ